MVDSANEKILRHHSVYLVKSVWELSEDIINAKFRIISENIQDSQAKERLNESYRILNRTIELIADDEYEKAEDPQTFKELLEALMDVFAMLFDSNIVEDGATVNFEQIDALSRDFYTRMNDRMDLVERDNQLAVSYPAITALIRMLRNCQQHREKPRDHITGKISFGNIHTLSSITLLSIYAYRDILGVWCDAIIHDQRDAIDE